MNWSELPPSQLLEACAKPSVSGAWEEFMRRFHPVITSAALRVSRRWGAGNSNEVDDVVQEIYLKLCLNAARILGSFRAIEPEAVFGYVKVVATNLAHDYFRQRFATKRGVLQMTSLTEAGEPVARSDDLERRLTLEQLDRLLVTVTQGENGSRDRAIFRLYFRQGMTAHAISQLPGIPMNHKGIEAVLYRLTRGIRSAIRNSQELGTL